MKRLFTGAFLFLEQGINIGKFYLKAIAQKCFSLTLSLLVNEGA